MIGRGEGMLRVRRSGRKVGRVGKAVISLKPGRASQRGDSIVFEGKLAHYKIPIITLWMMFRNITSERSLREVTICRRSTGLF
jgi:hypothetical protein